MNMMYDDCLKNALLEENIKFKIIEDTVPPILNKQRWFVIEPTLEDIKVFEKKIDEFLWMTLKEKYSLSFFYVKEKQNHLLKRVYLLDFRLPAQKAKEKFYPRISKDIMEEIELKPFPIKSFPSSDKSKFFSSKFFLYDEFDGIPIISTRYHITELSFITKSILEGHRITFDVKGDITIKSYLKRKRGVMSYQNVMFFQIKPCNGFYYYNSIIKSPYNTFKIDNYFLVELKELIEILFQIIIEVARREDLSSFYRHLADILKQFTNFVVDKTFSKVTIFFSKQVIGEKLILFNEIEFLCILIIKHFLGKKLEPVKDEKKIEKRKKYLVKNLKIIEEMLSITI